LNQLGQNAEALKAALVAEKITPNDPDLQFTLGYLCSLNNQPRDAIMHYRKSLSITPSQPVVLNNLAWLLATLPDDSLRNGKEAVELAEKANVLTGGKNVIILGTLAAAYAESNRFNDAIATAQKAIQLAELTNQKEFAEKNAKLLKLYSESKPYRESLVN
jgi:Flp pilus assembly protein TadD